jgi:7tm Chemosensory receptor
MLIVITYVSFFCIIVLGVYIRFRKINTILHESIHRNFKIIARLYRHLCEIIENVNQLFSTMILAAFGASIMSTVLTFYELYELLSDPNIPMQQIGVCISMHTWIIDGLIIMMSITIVCSVTTKEAERTFDILEGCRGNRSIQLFIQQLHHEDVNFSCGLFNFDWSIPILVSISRSTLFLHYKPLTRL